MKIKDTILFKIALILIVSVVITLALSGYLSYKFQEKQLTEISNKRVKLRLDRLAFVLREPLWAYNLSEIERILSYEFNLDETTAIVIKKENGEFLLGGRKVGDETIWDTDPKTASKPPVIDNDVVTVSKEIMYESTRIGYIELFYSYSPVREQLDPVIYYAVGETLIVSLILVMAIYLSLKRIIVQPIRELSRMMEEVSDENYTSGLRTHLKDEIGRLVNSFNKMIGRLKKQREELLTSEIRFRSLFDYANDAIVLLKDGKTVDCNIRACIMFEKSKEELMGLSPTEALKPVGDIKEMEIATNNYINLALSGETQYFEWEYYDKEGKIKYGQVSLQKFELSDGIYLQAITRDITDKKESEAKIAESEERYKALVENAPESIFSLDYKEAFFTSLNPAFEKITGWKKEEWLGKSFVPMIHPEDLESAYSHLQLIRQGETPPPFELRMIHKDGRYIPIEVTATPKREGGIITGLLGIARDVEEKKAAEEKIRTSLREKEILLKEIHHRVKNNLQIISSLLSLQASSIKDKHALEMFKNSQNRVKSMALIHERLYKSDNLAQINFSEYVKSLTAYLFRSYQTNTHNIGLKLEIEDNLYLSVDTAIPCGLIINELVTNAVKYAFPDCISGEIYVSFSLDEDNDRYRLLIGNDGVSMPKDFNMENPQTLGLQLVNILTNQLKGTLELNSGGITEFIVIFPARKN